MEERYESATIMITVGLGERRMRWKPICRVKFMKGRREVIKDLELDLDYGTSEQAERASHSQKSGLMQNFEIGGVISP